MSEEVGVLEDLVDPDYGQTVDEDDKDDDKDDKDDKDKDDDKDDKDDDDKEDDDDDKDDDDDDESDDEVNFDNLPKEVKKAHPELEGIIDREKEFSEFFKSPKDAQIAVSQAQGYQALTHELSETQSLKGLLTSINKGNSKIAQKMVDTFFHDVVSIDQGFGQRVAQPIVSNLLHGIYQKAMSSGDKNLAAAVKYVNREVFGQTTPVASIPPPKEEKKDDNEKRELHQQNMHQIRGQVQQTSDNLMEEVVESLDDRMDTILKDVEGLSKYEIRSIKQDAIDKLNSRASKDSAYQEDIRDAWTDVVRSGFSRSAVREVKRIMDKKARSLLPRILKDQVGEVTDNEVFKKRGERRKAGHGRASTRDKGSGHPQKGESELEFLAR